MKLFKRFARRTIKAASVAKRRARRVVAWPKYNAKAQAAAMRAAFNADVAAGIATEADAVIVEAAGNLRACLRRD